MRGTALLLSFSSSFFVSATALAQLPPPPPPPPGGGGGGGGSLPPPSQPSNPPPSKRDPSPPPSRREEPRRRPEPSYDGPSGDAPPARVGFQIGIRTGVAVPLGNVYDGAKMSDTWGVQIPLVVDIGGKISRNVFLGGYLGFGFGGAGGVTGNDCERRNRSCGAFRFDLGFMFQYHFIPDGSVNPWLGLGLGYELNQIGIGNGNATTTTSYGGVNFLQFLFGIDFRINRTVGLGPFMGFSVGQYLSGSAGAGSGNIPNKSVHEWFSLGFRVVFFP